MKSVSNVSSENSHINQNHKKNNIIVNNSLKTRRTPNDFNYWEELKKERLLKNKKGNFFMNNKTTNQNIETEKGNTQLFFWYSLIIII